MRRLSPALSKTGYFGAPARLSSIPQILVYVVRMNPRHTIEHDPSEPKIDRRPESFRLLFLIVALGWAGYFYSFRADWTAIFLGFGTGAVFILWVSCRYRHLW
ncbi:hypothetical protein CN093_17535 [Sinorhizobium meliloti]|nr:hypothetical protein CN215_01920 [Sinorhizobium meliloti]RVO38528.1 hypothetical protein CN093_17535 [Sinorhizobium meliloti]